jgi:hypothetical protein
MTLKRAEARGKGPEHDPGCPFHKEKKEREMRDDQWMPKRPMTDEQREQVAYHEAGHLALTWWLRLPLGVRRAAYLHEDRFGGATAHRNCDYGEGGLMRLIAGPMAEFTHILGHGGVKGLIRFRGQYRLPNSDSTRMRNLVKELRGGKDDKAYQLRVQGYCREIIEEPKMWAAITAIADHLVLHGEIDGEEAEGIFEAHGAQTWRTNPKYREGLAFHPKPGR